MNTIESCNNTVARPDLAGFSIASNALALIASLLLCFAGTNRAAAQTPAKGSQYIELIGGIAQPSSSSYDSSIGGETGKSSVDFESGVAFGAAYGYFFDKGFSGEFEYLWQRADADSMLLPGLPAGGEGDIASVTMMFNLYKHWNLGKEERWTGYLGAGAGWLQEVSSDYEVEGVEYSFDDSGFGFQIMAGVTRSLNEKWYVSAELRHLLGGSLDLENERNSSDTVSVDYDVTSLQLGLGFRF